MLKKAMGTCRPSFGPRGAAHGDLLGEVQRSRGIVDADIARDEVMRDRHRQVIHLMARGLDGDDLVPINAAGRRRGVLAVSKNIGDHFERGRDKPPACRHACWSSRRSCGRVRPRHRALRGGDAVPDADRDHVAIGLHTAIAEPLEHALGCCLLAVDVDLRDECEFEMGSVISICQLGRANRGTSPIAGGATR